MENYIADHCSNNEEFYSKDTFFKFALDSIATSAFGIEIDTFKDPNNVFCKMVKEVQRAEGSEAGSAWEMFKLMMTLTFPFTKPILPVDQFSKKGFSFLKKALLQTIAMRKSGSNKRRNDIIDLVIELGDHKQEAAAEDCEDQFERDASIDMADVKKDETDLEEMLVSNAFLLFVAALDTTSSSLTFAVHYLLKYPHLQDNIRDEITEVVGDSNEISFEQIQEMKYLEKFLLETLRNSHPFGNILERVCTKDYLVPGTQYTVRRGEVVNFSILYERTKDTSDKFYNAAEFDPENFSPSNNPDSFSALAFGQVGSQSVAIQSSDKYLWDH